MRFARVVREAHDSAEWRKVFARLAISPVWVVERSPGSEVVMRAAVAVGLFLAPVALGQQAGRPDPVKAEWKRLEGVWEGYVVEGRGEKADRGPFHLRLTVAGEAMTAVDLNGGSKSLGTGKLAIDPAGPLRQLDAVGAVLPARREKTYLGVYQLDGDTLRWCVGNKQDVRPDEFRSHNGNYLLVLKRKK
jgi:uncharacterized protein (TIGR03067 family)